MCVYFMSTTFRFLLHFPWFSCLFFCFCCKREFWLWRTYFIFTKLFPISALSSAVQGEVILFTLVSLHVWVSHRKVPVILQRYSDRYNVFSCVLNRYFHFDLNSVHANRLTWQPCELNVFSLRQMIWKKIKKPMKFGQYQKT